MEYKDFLPNDNCWKGAETIKEAIDNDSSAAFVNATLGNNRFSDERLLYMAVHGRFKVLDAAVRLAVSAKREPRVGKIIEWMIASQYFIAPWPFCAPVNMKCDLENDGETIAEAIKPGLKFLSSNDWNRIISRTTSYCNGIIADAEKRNEGKSRKEKIKYPGQSIEVVTKVLALFGKSVGSDPLPDDGKTYAIPGKYDRMGVVNVGGFLMMSKDLVDGCNYEEAKAIEAELLPYGWRLPSKDEAKTIEEALPHDGGLCYSDKLEDPKYDLAMGTYEFGTRDYGEEHSSYYDEYCSKAGAEAKVTAKKLKLDPRIYDFFPHGNKYTRKSRKYLGWCTWTHNGSIFSIPLGRENKWIVPGRKHKDKKISLRLIRDPDLVVKDI